VPGYYIEEYDAQDFSSVELDTDPPRKVGPVQIARNYTDLMVKRGGRKLSDDVDSGGAVDDRGVRRQQARGTQHRRGRTCAEPARGAGEEIVHGWPSSA
jgi:hypothetical protein